MLKKNLKVNSVLIALMTIVFLHFLLAYLYKNSYDYVKNNYQDATLEFFAYTLSLLTIIGAIGLASAKKSFLKVVSILLMLPNALFVLVLIKAYLINTGNSFISLKNYHDYLFIFPFFADGLVFFLLPYIISYLPSKNNI